jgi:hypothetical protein
MRTYVSFAIVTLMLAANLPAAADSANKKITAQLSKDDCIDVCNRVVKRCSKDYDEKDCQSRGDACIKSCKTTGEPK